MKSRPDLGPIIGSAQTVIETSVLLVAAHPDDEVLGASSILWRSRNVTLMHVTDGAPKDRRDADQAGFASNSAYSAARTEELMAALSEGGVRPSEIIPLGFQDQESYLHLGELTERLRSLMERLRPGILLSHSYEGGHPDHDSCAFASQFACSQLGQAAPLRIEFTSYFARQGDWAVGEFLPDSDSPEVVIPFSEADQQRKRRMLDHFVSQAAVIRRFPLLFERFRLAPEYDFNRPAHEGQLLYETFNWGITGEHFRECAQAAEQELRSLAR